MGSCKRPFLTKQACGIQAFLCPQAAVKTGMANERPVDGDRKSRTAVYGVGLQDDGSLTRLNVPFERCVHLIIAQFGLLEHVAHEQDHRTAEAFNLPKPRFPSG